MFSVSKKHLSSQSPKGAEYTLSSNRDFPIREFLKQHRNSTVSHRQSVKAFNFRDSSPTLLNSNPFAGDLSINSRNNIPKKYSITITNYTFTENPEKTIKSDNSKAALIISKTEPPSPLPFQSTNILSISKQNNYMAISPRNIFKKNHYFKTNDFSRSIANNFELKGCKLSISQLRKNLQFENPKLYKSQKNLNNIHLEPLNKVNDFIPEEITSKFTSPAAAGSSRPDTVETDTDVASIQSLSLGQSLINKEPTLNEMIEEMSSTSDVTKYHEFKFKLMTEDKFYKDINGNIRKWKAGDNLGNGSYGNVIKAFNVETGEIFAVKRLFFNKENQCQAELVDSMDIEINILKDLSHANIVKYLGCEKVYDTLCIYFEYMPGGCLSRLLYNLGPLPEDVVKIYLKQILSGLIYLHSLNILHRDIKGSNILIDSEGTLKLGDFGCSKKYSTTNDSGFLTSAKGSLPWMAPEVVKQSGYGRKADIWSIGCLTLEMLNAEPPWKGHDNYIIVMMKIAMTDELPVFPTSISAVAKDFIMVCLQKDPHKRPSAEELMCHPFLS